MLRHVYRFAFGLQAAGDFFKIGVRQTTGGAGFFASELRGGPQGSEGIDVLLGEEPGFSTRKTHKIIA
jgi:hypothetical protein